VQAVFANHDYEPQAIARDAVVRGALATMGISFHTAKDQVIFERDEVLTQGGTPYACSPPTRMPGSRRSMPSTSSPTRWRATSTRWRLARRVAPSPVPTLAEIGFEPTNLAGLKIPPGQHGREALLDDFLPRMDRYGETRDFPAVKGPSYLGVHLRFGTVSIRAIGRPRPCAHAGRAARRAAVWLSELIWRDFYFQILANFPMWRMRPMATSAASSPNTTPSAGSTASTPDTLFKAWCEGRTGYPLVDAAMAQINQTGYMHNRLRMVVASFLCKDLGIDWRRGERYFAEQLNDFDLSANNGGWQWASSSGCDAQPYFRIFNPVSQSEKFDARASSSAATCPNWPACPRSAPPPWKASPMERLAAGVTLGKDYPHPSWCTTRRATRPCCATPWSRRPERLASRPEGWPASGRGFGACSSGAPGQQLFFRIRLAQVVVDAQLHACSRCFSAMREVIMMMGRCFRRSSADVARQVEAVHARHFDVGQHHGGQFVGQALQRLQAVGRQVTR
jgi:deoxyribodipyrimidine photo-lyase